MPTVGTTSRPGYVYDQGTDTWIPIGVGPHSHDTDYVTKSTIDAKGDLLAGSANDTVSRLAVGNNGETLVADSSTSTGLRYQATKSTQNAVINGAFDIWQRGTSFTSGLVYCADRWYTYTDGSAATWSRQAGSGEFQYAMRIARNSGSTNTGVRDIWYNSAIEEATQFAGKTITLSFYAKAGANYSAASNALLVNGYSGTSSTDTNRVNGAYASGDTQILGQTFNITTTLTRYSVTLTLGASVTQFAFGFRFTPTGTAGANDWVEITGVQWEVGSTPTTFRRSGGTLAGELAACQRYYARYNNSAANGDYMFGMGTGTTSTSVLVTLKTLTTMRIAPTSIDYSTLAIQDGANAKIAATSVAFNNSTPDSVTMVVTVASGVTTYRPYFFHQNGSSTAYVGFNAEL